MRGRGRAGSTRFGAVALATLLLAGCWRQVGFDAAHTWSNGSESKLTAANVGALAPVWSVELPGRAQGEAIVTDGRIYLNEVVPDDGELRVDVHALDAGTGATAWQQPLATVPAATSLRAVGLPPAAVGDELWTGYELENLFRTGTACASRRVRLDAATGASIADDAGFGSTAVPSGPVIAQNVTPDNLCERDLPSVVVRDGSSLATTWSAPLGQFPVSDDLVGPTVAGGKLYVTNSSGIDAYASAGCGAATCGPVWRHAVAQFTIPLGPVVAGPAGQVYFVLYHPFSGSTPADLVALTATTGQVAWQAPLGTAAIAGDQVKLAAAGGSVYVATSTPSGRGLAAFAAGGCGAATCSPTWTASTTHDDGGFGTRPVVAGGVVYLPDAVGVHAFAAAGCGAATCPAIADVPVAAGARFVTVDGGRLYVIGGDSRLTALAPA